MIVVGALIQLAVMAAAPQATPATDATPRRTERQCVPHHLNIPGGKGPVNTIMRCTDRPVDGELSMNDKRANDKADKASNPTG